MTATTLQTDANCIEAIAAGRPEFDLVITSGTVIDDAVANDQPIVKIGEPIYAEDLAIAADKSGLNSDALMYEIDQIVGQMHEDGTLTAAQRAVVRWRRPDAGAGRVASDSRSGTPKAGVPPSLHRR